MPENIKLTDEEYLFERMLEAIPPVPTAIDRDALMFAAGAASVARPVVWPWRIACGIAVMACVGMLYVNKNRATIEPSMAIHDSTTSLISPSPVVFSAMTLDRPLPAYADVWSNLHLRQEILAHGLDALQRSATSPAADNSIPPLNADMLNALPLWERHAVSSQGDHS